MSKVAHAYADDKPGANLPNEAPAGQVNDPSYKTKGSTEAVPVIDDDAPVEDPIRPEEADSDKQLAKDEAEAIDKSNIIGERTRHAIKSAGTYQEPSDEQMGLTE
ncbi:hypothetical protein SMACR_04537 [Sordaria macrospora]|uniref:WGS project CABT00000000 data, contig 2.20 n=2 Tax=Sordaria macrospora TaxID=5147 RepID=F7W1R3_SORMK|nr:uncharacterized protein SMAC_04537 [Sordaria macrospora k-hell]KAA8630744.1 hypothetical protein SMACR_04537 [Sordaria macrospora]KAH7631425.1 hypothetical protein B0T09DRAFT_335368 [Sordaria sp. MPI-SDFR-AT-0083]WPJ62756.1 hypothetical protein SMAC4_04537 [Sordaria macrospora]CCC11548.1 unnamed protein product [Sordaria macrospora k-hell]